MLELTCGTPPEPRARTLGDLALLRQTRLATPGEVADWIEWERLYGRGCGAVDCTLLASVLLTPSTKLWTRDRRRAQLAEQFGVHYLQPDLH